MAQIVLRCIKNSVGLINPLNIINEMNPLHEDNEGNIIHVPEVVEQDLDYNQLNDRMH
jgi:hypothetical protein